MADLPDWTAFDRDAAPALPDHAERPGRLVAVIATTGAREEGWALDVTVDIAKAWSRSGHKVVVADTALAAATLHQRVGTANTEGVADTVLFGSSVRRVAKPAEDGAFFVITAGTAASDPAAVLDSERWRRLCSGFVEAGVTLISYVGAESEGKSTILAMATDVLVLSSPTEDARPAVDGASAPIRAITGRTPSVPRDTHTPDDGARAIDPLPPANEDGGGDDIVEPEPAVAPEPPEEETAYSGLPEAEATIVEGADGDPAPASTGSRRLVFLVMSLIVLGIVAAASFGWVDLPGISPEDTPPPVSEASTPVAMSEAIAPTSSTLAYSVTVGAFQDESVAATRADEVSRAEAVFLTVSPVLVDGVLFHRVLVGPATDSASAESLADRVSAETGADRSAWVVRETPVAFHLGEMPDLESATRRAQVLRGLGVPAYVLAVDYADDSTRYRVYAGAYADEHEASFLRGRLETQGLDNATLSRRVGRVP